MPTPWAAVDGHVNALAISGDTAYVGGNFTWVGRYRGAAAIVDTAAGTVSATEQPGITGVQYYGPLPPSSVTATASDGAGGWFVVGNFDEVHGVERHGVVHRNADGTLDLAFKPEIDLDRASVEGLARAGNMLVLVGGRTIGLDAATGARKWIIDADGAMWAAPAADGDRVYVGGGFGSIGGASRSRLAQSTAGTGAVRPLYRAAEQRPET